MRIHKKGWITITITFLFVAVTLTLVNIAFPVNTWVHYVLYALGFTFFFLVVRFFRHPVRNVNLSENHILSAADGTVVVIEEIQEDDFFNDRRIQVSVFMTPLNVHVNWYPISGEIVSTHYHKGKYYPAWSPKSSKLNERQSTVIRDKHGRQIVMIQIAGMMARRVFTNAFMGNIVFQGEEAGIIKFGSRVDLILPAEAVVKVKLHQQVRACETVIAELPEKVSI